MTPPAITGDAHVADLVLADPGRARVFEALGIDYCCGGRRPLAEACDALDLDLADVVGRLDAPREASDEDVDWTAAPIAALVDHIVEAHHAYLRAELPPLRALVAKVARAHGDAHPELAGVQATFERTADELERHLRDEEEVAFPACLAAAAGERHPALDEPLAALVHDHDEVAVGLRTLRALTAGYAPPPDACNSYRAMLDRLATLEADTHRHVHEENNVLFPRALAAAAA